MRVEMQQIRKSFGSNNVLKDVSLDIKGGEICALLGENGAGKSTLMNILGGVHQKDSGEIKINGEPVYFPTPSDSQAAGIVFVHQELNLINDLPIYENMYIGRELKTAWGTLDISGMIKGTREIFEKMNVDLDPRQLVGKLDASYKQIVEICRAMLSDASLIIMDEPTTSLTDQEAERVFAMMETLKQRQIGIIFISHKLNEVIRVCDRYAVLRDGKRVASGNVSDVTISDLAREMVGYDVRTSDLTRQKSIGSEALRVEGLTSEGLFQDVSFTVRSGEIVGFTGLLGDGRSELFQAIFGASTYDTGKIYVSGEEVVIKNPASTIEAGLGYVPRNRKENAILEDLNIIENASITTWEKFSRGGVINASKHRTVFNKHRETLRLKMGELTDAITSLSGGNQQKVVLAKWLATEPDVLILDNPTQGVDVGAKEDIYDIILELAAAGIAVIVLSSEAAEIIRICDRSFVMFHGEIQGEVIGEEMTEHTIMNLATGGEHAQDKGVDE